MNEHQKEQYILKKGIYYTLSFTLLLWIIKAIEWANDVDLSFLGVYPRTLEGTIGIITAPLIHGDVFHLLSNTFPFILLGIGIFYFYDKIALEVILWIYFMTGFWVWIAARDAYHIGASGVIYGMVGFLFFSGIFRKDTRSIAISLVVLFLYRGMIYGLIPTDGGVSWESHLLGAIAGTFCAFYFRKVKVERFTNEENETIIEEESETEIREISTTSEEPIIYRYHYIRKKEASNKSKLTDKPLTNPPRYNNSNPF